MNTGRVSAPAVETMERLAVAYERLLRAMDACVGPQGKVVSLEEYRVLRDARAYMDGTLTEAMDWVALIDYAVALLSTGLKENSVFGQRYQQLFAEAHDFRVEMLDRQSRRETEGPEPSAPAGMKKAA